MAFVGHDQVEGVDRDVEFLRVHIAAIALPEANPSVTTKQVDTHPLYGADVDERVTQLWVRQQRVRHHVWVKLLLLVEIGLLETLRIDRVEFVELEAWLGLEAGEGAHRLRGQCAAVDEEQDATSDAGLHEPIDLVDGHQRFAGAGRHCHEHLPFAVGNGLLDRCVCLHLIRPQVWIQRNCA
ncbi:Uncharacterised protein [Mycobacteroides abscessus subsp. abscessus]|nr:Uncharacterised protein [Mycobacteroides abscessus subsp. abscessus]